MEPINKFVQEMQENKRNVHASRLDELVKYIEIFKATNQSQIHHLIQQNSRIVDIFANNFPLIIKEFPKETKQRVAEIVWVYEMDTGVPFLVEKFQKEKTEIKVRETDQDWSEYIVNMLKVAQLDAKSTNSIQDVKEIQKYLDQLQLILPRDVDLKSLPKEVVKFTVTSIHWVNLQVLPSIASLTRELVEKWAKEENLTQYDPLTTVILSIVPETKNGKLAPMKIPFPLVEYPKRNEQYVLTQPFFAGAVFPEPVFSAINKMALQGIRYVMREKGWLPDSPWIIYEKWFANMYAPEHLEYLESNKEDEEISESEVEEEPTPEDLAFINDENAYVHQFCTFLIKEVGRN
jgi:hypothetical protein